MLLLPSPLFQAMRNKFGGAVFYPIAGRQISREFVVPANPQSSFQGDVRAALTAASVAYSALSSAEKSSWEAAAANVQIVDGFGQSTQIPAKALYVRVNAYRILDGQAVVDTAPATTSPAAYTALTSVVISGGNMTITPVGGAQNDLTVISLSAPLPGTTRLARTNDLRLATTVVANSIVVQGATPPITIATSALRFSLQVGDRIGVRLIPLSANYIPGATLFERSVTIA